MVFLTVFSLVLLSFTAGWNSLIQVIPTSSSTYSHMHFPAAFLYILIHSPAVQLLQELFIL